MRCLQELCEDFPSIFMDEHAIIFLQKTSMNLLIGVKFLICALCHGYCIFFTRFRQMRLAWSNTEHILFGCKSTVLPMKMMALLGVAVVKEWRSVKGFRFLTRPIPPGCVVPVTERNHKVFINIWNMMKFRWLFFKENAKALFVNALIGRIKYPKNRQIQPNTHGKATPD